MKRIIKYAVIILIVLAVLIWLSFGFYNNNYNPAEWEKDVKAPFLFCEFGAFLLSPFLGGIINILNDMYE